MKRFHLLAVPMLALGMLFAFATVSSAATCTRITPEGFPLTEWNDPTLWSCGAVPGAGDVAILPRGADNFAPIAHIALNNDVTLSRFVVEAGRIEGKHVITVTDEMNWSGGDLHYTNTAPFFSPSVIVIAPDAVMNVQVDRGLMSSLGTFINEGTTIWSNGAYTFSPNLGGIDSHFINNGVFTTTASGVSWSTEFENNGSLYVAPSSPDPVSLSAITNKGDFTLVGGTLTSSIEQVTGTTTLNGATLENPLFGVLEFQGGRVTGSGTIRSSVNNSGALFAPTGLLRIDSGNVFQIAYEQEPAGTLELPISGLSRGTDYGSLSINGSAVFSGTLDVLFKDGFTPAAEDGFIVASCTGLCEGGFITNTSLLPLTFNPTYIALGENIELPTQPLLLLPYVINMQDFRRKGLR